MLQLWNRGKWLMFLLVVVLESYAEPPTSRSVDTCLMTALGTEFMGTVNTSRSGLPCQHWEMGPKKLQNSGFPEGSRKGARNFCRNPTRDQDGPWCYVMDTIKVEEPCGIPICDLKTCRLTGPGLEYQGPIRVSSSNNHCQPWVGFLTKNTSSEGKVSCANPSNDPAGPWCNVIGPSGMLRRELCDIPLCNVSECVRVSVGPNYSVFSDISSKRNLSISARLWDPVIDPNSTLSPKILLSSISSMEGNTGFELDLVPLNHGGGFILRRWPSSKTSADSKDAYTWQPSQPSLETSASGLVWTNLWISWDESELRVSEAGLKDISLVSLPIENEQIQFFSVAGRSALWEWNSCCEILTTTDLTFNQFWKLRTTVTGHVLKFSLRAFRSVFLKLYHGPHASRAVIQIALHSSNRNTIHTITDKGDTGELLNDSLEKNIFLDPWQWTHLSLNVFSDRIQVMLQHSPTITTILMEATHPSVIGARWFSIGSNNTLAQWVLHCRFQNNSYGNGPCLCSLADETVNAAPPECMSDSQPYSGHQRAASSGHPCLPWTDYQVPYHLQRVKLFPENTVSEASNFCRNPDQSTDGAWCYTGVVGFQRENCDIRRCRHSNCKMAGTGNDYMGTKNTTISGRDCQDWNTNTPHQINPVYLDKDKFPERNLSLISNYCRDPLRTIAGSWCFTTDPLVPFDLCDVKDCDKEDACTIITVQSSSSSYFYILPQWRSEGMKFWLKEWQPGKPDGVRFVIKSGETDNRYELLIGDDDNESIQLYKVENSVKKHLKKKSMVRVISIGKWAGFWLRMNTGLVELGYENTNDPFFSYVESANQNDSSLFTPTLLGFGSIKLNLIGLHFPCEECLTQRFEGDAEIHAKPKVMENIYPIHLWRPNGQTLAQRLKYTEFYLYARGKGTLNIFLTDFPSYKAYLSVFINYGAVQFQYHPSHQPTEIYLKHTPFDEIKWTKLNFWLNETDVRLSFVDPLDNAYVINYTLPDIDKVRYLFYYLTIRGKEALDWTLNCPPTDLSQPGRDGGWSEWGPWHCNVRCGGGRGFRTRNCSNPTPSILGKYCVGSNVIKGACNESPCGSASPGAIMESKRYLNSKSFSFLLKEGESLNHTCHPPAVEQLLGEMEIANFTWTLGGLATLENHVNTTNLWLPTVRAKDSGVYTLVVQGLAGHHVTICVATLAVLEHLNPREGQVLKLASNALILSSLYPHVELRWVLNSTVWRSFDNLPLTTLEILRLGKINQSHGGEWKCIVTQAELDFSWTTAWYKVEVRHAATLSTRLIEDPVGSMIFGSVARTFGEGAVVPTLILLLLCLATFSFFTANFLLRL